MSKLKDAIVTINTIRNEDCVAYKMGCRYTYNYHSPSEMCGFGGPALPSEIFGICSAFGVDYKGGDNETFHIKPGKYVLPRYKNENDLGLLTTILWQN